MTPDFVIALVIAAFRYGREHSFTESWTVADLIERACGLDSPVPSVHSASGLVLWNVCRGDRQTSGGLDLAMSIGRHAFHEGQEACRQGDVWGDGVPFIVAVGKVVVARLAGERMPTPFTDDDSMTDLYNAIPRK